MTSTYSIDFSKLTLKNKEVVGDWEYLICENEGSFSEGGQMVTFDFNGIEITVYFNLSLRGWYTYTPASYMEPEDGEVKITDIDFDIEEVYIDDYKVNLSKELIKTLEIVLKNNIENE
jgi:hypothetical protein